MEDTFNSDQFFEWMDKQGVSTSEMAVLLKVDARSLSTYRSRGLPKKKIPLALRIMSEWEASGTNSRIPVELSDEELDLITKASRLVDAANLRDFIRSSVVARAKDSHQGCIVFMV